MLNATTISNQSPSKIGKLFKRKKPKQDQAYNLLADNYVESVFNNISEEYVITDQQINFIKHEVSNLKLTRYEERFKEIIEIFNIQRVDAAVEAVLFRYELKVDSNSLSKLEKEKFVQLLQTDKYSKKFIVMLFNYNIHSEYVISVVNYLTELDNAKISEEELLNVYFKHANRECIINCASPLIRTYTVYYTLPIESAYRFLGIVYCALFLINLIVYAIDEYTSVFIPAATGESFFIFLILFTFPIIIISISILAMSKLYLEDFDKLEIKLVKCGGVDKIR